MCGRVGGPAPLAILGTRAGATHCGGGERRRAQQQTGHREVARSRIGRHIAFDAPGSLFFRKPLASSPALRSAPASHGCPPRQPPCGAVHYSTRSRRRTLHRVRLRKIISVGKSQRRQARRPGRDQPRARDGRACPNRSASQRWEADESEGTGRRRPLDQHRQPAAACDTYKKETAAEAETGT